MIKNVRFYQCIFIKSENLLNCSLLLRLFLVSLLCLFIISWRVHFATVFVCDAGFLVGGLLPYVKFVFKWIYRGVVTKA